MKYHIIVIIISIMIDMGHGQGEKLSWHCPFINTPFAVWSI